ncbi:MAG: sigma-70 family RNA polymerase sigma factor [Chloroflexi bacterium]|nr:sigma-70 family RNA polymerase sigma factor [Chloroflexota bacterium]
MINQSDAVLVQRSRAGDKAAFSTLVTRYLPRVRRVLLSMLRYPAEVDDILQETFLQAYLSLDTLRDPTRFRAWVCGIGINLARMWLRSLPSGLVSWEMLAQMETAVSTQPTPEQLTERRLVAAKLSAAIADLPPAEREALLLVYKDGLSHRETAVALGASLSAVKVRVHRGRRRLRDRLSPEWAVKQPRVPSAPQKETIMIAVTIYDVIEIVSQFDMKDILQPILDVLPAEHHTKFLRDTTLTTDRMFTLIEILQALPEDERETVQKAFNPLIPHRIVLLREQDGDRVLPVWIGPFEAESIVIKLRNAPLKRPITYDLMSTLLELGQIKVTQAAVSRIHDKIFFGALFATVGNVDETTEIDCRVSDALSLAVRIDVPIVVTPEVMDESSEPASKYVRDEQGNYTLDHVHTKKVNWRSMIMG